MHSYKYNINSVVYWYVNDMLYNRNSSVKHRIEVGLKKLNSLGVKSAIHWSVVRYE